MRDPRVSGQVGFLFDHENDVPGGCSLEQSRFPTECIVAVEDIKAVTGLTFFTELSRDESQRLRATCTYDTWLSWVSGFRE
ncbi:hypothetical protein GCM10007420_21490 [Glycocaulis albus]|uniref:Uncharacterized protein n=1 Tax=Glycocaulis albus TaxID=1382801 RepID=A0ABQ1XW15_9PROT|nr:hypothetical protein GCM10007420_21490 [Glycocaulis albus]